MHCNCIAVLIAIILIFIQQKITTFDVFYAIKHIFPLKNEIMTLLSFNCLLCSFGVYRFILTKIRLGLLNAALFKCKNVFGVLFENVVFCSELKFVHSP